MVTVLDGRTGKAERRRRSLGSLLRRPDSARWMFVAPPKGVRMCEVEVVLLGRVARAAL